MTFGEKLAKLTEGRNRADLSRRAGLPQNAISDYINKSYLPRLDTARSLASVLGVPLDWLADDSKSWPPPQKTGEVAEISLQSLIGELARRYRLEALQFYQDLQAAAEVDWVEAALKALDIPADAPLPPEIERARQLYERIMSGLVRLSLFDPDTSAFASPDSLPENGISHKEISRNSLQSQAVKLRESCPGFEIMDDIYAMRLGHRTHTKEKKFSEQWRAELLSRLHDLKANDSRGEQHRMQSPRGGPNAKRRH